MGMATPKTPLTAEWEISLGSVGQARRWSRKIRMKTANALCLHLFGSLKEIEGLPHAFQDFGV